MIIGQKTDISQMSRNKFQDYCREKARSEPTEIEGIKRCRILGSCDCMVRDDDKAVAPHLINSGFWEAWISVAIARAIGPGAYCVDVGACFGYYTLLMAARVGAEGQVLSVEPNPELAELIRASVQMNGFINTTVLEKAAWDKEETLRLDVFSFENVGGSSVASTRQGIAQGTVEQSFEVETVILDDTLRIWPAVNLVKIDAEGAEYQVWRGLQETIIRHHPHIVMEFNASMYEDAEGFLDEIQTAGYRTYGITGKGKQKPLQRDEILNADPFIYLWLAQ